MLQRQTTKINYVMNYGFVFLMQVRGLTIDDAIKQLSHIPFKGAKIIKDVST